MKFSYEFNNLYGTVYRSGNLIFTPDGNSVISPVGNKISMFDLKKHKSETLPIEAKYNYTSLALSPNGISLVAVQENGEIHLISMISRTILHRMRTNRPILSIKFSPDSKYIAFTKEKNVFIYKSPGPFSKDYTPFVKVKVIHGFYDETTCLNWSDCSKLIAVGSKDSSLKICTVERLKNLHMYSLINHGGESVGIFFEAGSLNCWAVDSRGQLSMWDANLTPDQLQVGNTYAYPKTVIEKKRKKATNKDSDESESDENNDNDDNDTKDVEEYTKEEKEELEAYHSISLKYECRGRFYLNDNLENEKEGSQRRPDLTSTDYHPKTKILVAAYSNGVFLLLSLPDVSLIHSLAISDQTIGSVCFNKSGDWIAYGCPDLGQLLVWEWQSETYVLKQQGHASGMNSLAYSPDGSLVATGGEDSKVKLWNTNSGFCFVTFSEHEAAVTGICFTPNAKVVLSSSMDGTVRAFDMTRYRNFKTFTTTRPVQLSCVTVDSSGDLIAAGGKDVFEIYLWSLTTGRLVEVLSGHEGPVASLAFSSNPTSSQLASVSWDKTLKIWDALQNNSNKETIMITSEPTCVCWNPNGKNVSVSTLSGYIITFEAETAQQIGSISGRTDLRMGRGQGDKISAKKKSESGHFSSLCYSADGSSILAGGNSKYICIYNVQENILVKKFEVTQNRSFDCMDEIINRRNMTELGNMALVEDRDDPTHGRIKLPGTKNVDLSSRTVKLEVRVAELRFSPTGRNFAALTTEGLLIYSLDRNVSFDPWLLDTKITPAAIKESIKAQNHTKALIDSFKLNEKIYIDEAFEKTPAHDIHLIVEQWPKSFLKRLMNHVAGELEASRHLEFYLRWCKSILIQHGSHIKQHGNDLMPVLNLLVKNISRKSDDLNKVCENNKFSLNYLLTVGKKNDEDDLKAGDNEVQMKEADSDASDDDPEINMEDLKGNWKGSDSEEVEDDSESEQSDNESMDEG